jgi:protein gp37
MSETTEISYCDSTLNLEMGCGGCELWSDSVRTCYAGRTTETYAGRKGWPKNFGTPTIFPACMTDAEKWRDLSETERQGKPWLNGLPRIIFLNDMGDTFTSGLPHGWLADYLERMAATTHVYLSLTKRSRDAMEFSRDFRTPGNMWMGVTITTQASISRAVHLARSQARVKFLSVEPMLERITIGPALRDIDWVIVGGESGPGYRSVQTDWIRRLRDEVLIAGKKFFVKQLGGERNHRSELSDLPEDLRFREMPDWKIPERRKAEIQAELFG